MLVGGDETLALGVDLEPALPDVSDDGRRDDWAGSVLERLGVAGVDLASGFVVEVPARTSFQRAYARSKKPSTYRSRGSDPRVNDFSFRSREVLTFSAADSSYSSSGLSAVAPTPATGTTQRATTYLHETVYAFRTHQSADWRDR